MGPLFTAFTLTNAWCVWRENKSSWTKENVSSFLKTRKTLFNEKMKNNRASSPKVEKLQVDFKTLKTKQDLEAAQVLNLTITVKQNL